MHDYKNKFKLKSKFKPKKNTEKNLFKKEENLSFKLKNDFVESNHDELKIIFKLLKKKGQNFFFFFKCIFGF